MELGLVELVHRRIDLAEVQSGFQQGVVEPNGLFELIDSGLPEVFRVCRRIGRSLLPLASASLTFLGRFRFCATAGGQDYCAAAKRSVSAARPLSSATGGLQVTRRLFQKRPGGVQVTGCLFHSRLGGVRRPPGRHSRDCCECRLHPACRDTVFPLRLGVLFQRRGPSRAAHDRLRRFQVALGFCLRRLRGLLSWASFQSQTP